MKRKQVLLLGLLIALQITQLLSQVSVIEVTGKVMEKKGEQVQGVAGIELWVHSKQNKPLRKITEEDGSFSFKALKSQTDIRIDIPPTKFAVLDPRDGSIELSKAQLSIEVIITVVSQESNSELYQEINRLNAQVKQLDLSKSRLNALYENMRDSLVNLNDDKNRLAADLEASKAKLARSKAANEELSLRVKNLEEELLSREKENQILKEALYEALEEKYLRQQRLFQDISENFKRYILSAKDLADQAPKIMNHVKTNNFYSYREVFKTYNKIYPQIEAEYLSQIKGVERYWQDGKLSEELEETFQYLIDTVHKERLLVPYNELNGFIQLSKIGKVKSKAKEIEVDLPPVIQELERRVHIILKKLEETT